MSALVFHIVGGAPDPVAPFSHAVEADGWVFVTGQMPFTDIANDSPYPASIEDQTHQAIANNSVLKSRLTVRTFIATAIRQKRALPGVRGNGITSRTLESPVAYATVRSNPNPNPACGTVP